MTDSPHRRARLLTDHLLAEIDQRIEERVTARLTAITKQIGPQPDAPPAVNPQPAPDRLLLTITEAADELRISRSHAYELVSAGTIPHIRLGNSLRVPRSALEAMIERELEGWRKAYGPT